VKDIAVLLKALRASARSRDLRPPSVASDAWLFAASSQAVLIVDLINLTLIEANPAAASLLASTRSALIGSSIFNAFAKDSEKALRQAVAGARLGGSSSVSTHAASRALSQELDVTLSLVHAGSDSYLLMHLTSPLLRDPGTEVSSPVLDVIEQCPEGFVLTDLGLRVTYANRAFIDMAGLDSPEDLRGKSLAHWLEFSQNNLAALETQSKRREAVSVWTTTLRASSFRRQQVEITAVAVPDGAYPCWAFRVHAVAPETPVTSS
jgi:PAS domain-containing protein